MGTLYVDTGGNAANSGSSDNNAADLTGVSWAAAGAVVTLDAGTILTGVVTAGATQSTINLAGATNTGGTIFFITATAGSGGASPTVTVDTAPTGGPGPGWSIGGRYLWPSGAGVNVLERCLGLGDNSAPDILIWNQTPASKTVTFLTSRNAGNSTKGEVILRRKTGVRPVIQITNTTVCFTITNNYWRLEGFEFQQNGASGNVNNLSGVGIVVYDCKVSDGGGNGINSTAAGTRILFSEVSGCTGSGIANSSTDYVNYGNYVHDNTADGYLYSATTARGLTLNCISDSNAGQGIYIFGALTGGTGNNQIIIGNTVYGNSASGLRVTDADVNLSLFGNIFMNNGDAAGEYNIQIAAGSAELLSEHGYNCFNTAGAGGSANLLNLTANSTEITTDPLFTNAAGGDFSLGSSSPCKATGFPGQFLGANLGYMDMGAVQRQEAGGGAGGGAVFGAVGGVVA